MNKASAILASPPLRILSIGMSLLSLIAIGAASIGFMLGIVTLDPVKITLTLSTVCWFVFSTIWFNSKPA